MDLTADQADVPNADLASARAAIAVADPVGNA